MNQQPQLNSSHCNDGSSSNDSEKKKEINLQNEIHSLIAKEMNKLSLTEREKILDDVHGIRRPKEETTQFITQKLKEFHDEIELLKRMNDPRSTQQQQEQQQQVKEEDFPSIAAYREAESMSKAYVSDPKLLLMFLRTEEFSISDAARRLIAFFDEKKKLFGANKLVKDITYDDLDDDDVKAIKSGGLHISSQLDRAGRPILLNVAKMRDFKVPVNAQRAFYYIVMSTLLLDVHPTTISPSSLSLSENIQRNGIIFLTITHGVDPKAKSMHGNMRKILPIRIVSVHLCCKDLEDQILCNAALFKLPSKARVRYRVHFGSILECQRELLSFGIPDGTLPKTNADVAFIRSQVDDWLVARQSMERRPNGYETISVGTAHQTQSASLSLKYSAVQTPLHQHVSIISTQHIVPLPNDVLFGRGKEVSDNLGNKKYKRLIEQYYPQWDRSSRDGKTMITELIVRFVKEWPGRFLKRQQNSTPSISHSSEKKSFKVTWEEVDHGTARSKVAHAFRNRRMRDPSNTITTTSNF